MATRPDGETHVGTGDDLAAAVCELAVKVGIELEDGCAGPWPPITGVRATTGEARQRR